MNKKFLETMAAGMAALMLAGSLEGLEFVLIEDQQYTQTRL